MEKRNNIKQIRTLRGIQQKKMAIDIGVAQPIISRWENNINQPDIESLKKVASYLKCTIEDLVVYTDDNVIFSGNTGVTASKIQAGENINISVPSLLDYNDSISVELLRVARSLDMRERTHLLSYAYELLDKKKTAPEGAEENRQQEN